MMREKIRLVALGLLVVGAFFQTVSRTDAANIALGKPALGQYYDGRFPVSAVTDGVTTDTPHILIGTKDLDNYWLLPNGLTGGDASFTLDLLGVYDISQVNLVNTENGQHGAGDSGTDAFELFTSLDGITFTSLTSGNLAEGNVATLLDGLNVMARYVKFQADSYFTGDQRAGLNEIEIEGVLNDAYAWNVAAGRPAVVAHEASYDSRFPATAVVDGMIQDLRRLSDDPIINSYWLDLAKTTNTNTVDIDLQGVYNISEFVAIQSINYRHSGSDQGDRGTGDFQILASLDGVNFTPVLADTLTDRIGVTPNQSIPETFTPSGAVAARYIRFQADTYYGTSAGLSELAAIGTTMNPALERVAGFDIDLSSAPVTYPGWIGVNDGGGSGGSVVMGGTDGAISISIENNDKNDRDRGTYGALPTHTQSKVLRDFTYKAYGGSVPADALNVDLTGLEPGAEYLVRVYSFDGNGNNTALSAWFVDPVHLDLGGEGNTQFVGLHQNLQSQPAGGMLDLRLTADASGGIHLVGRGAGSTTGTNNLALFNGVEIFKVDSSRFTDVIKVDVNNILANQGPVGATEPGFVPLALDTPGATSQSGSVTDGGVTVTVTTDRTDSPTRHRNNTGEDLFGDFVFANDALDVLIEGLTVGQTYEITIFTQDTWANSGQMSTWFVDNDTTPVRTVQYNQYNAAANLDASSFSFFAIPDDTSLTIQGRNLADRAGDLVFLNGLTVRAVPEPAAWTLLLCGLLGWAGFRAVGRKN